MRILFQGDSITDGNRYKTEEQRWDLNHQIGHGWQFVVASELGYKYPGKFEFFNRAVSGETCVELNIRWENDALMLKPDIMLLLIGVNDANRNSYGQCDLTAADYRQGLTQLIERTQSALPGVKIILLEPFCYQTERKLPEIIAAEQALIAEIAAKYGCGLVKLQKKFDEASKETGTKYWIWDDVHPTEAGHGLIAREVLDYLYENIL